MQMRGPLDRVFSSVNGTRLEDHTAAGERGRLKSRISRHSAKSAWAASRAGDPAICPPFSASLARRNRRRHSEGLSRITLPLPHPHPSLPNPGGTAGIPVVLEVNVGKRVKRNTAQRQAVANEVGGVNKTRSLVLIAVKTRDSDKLFRC